MKEHNRIYKSGYLFAQKNKGPIIHIVKFSLGKSLCGKKSFYAFFKPVEGHKICKKCLKIYRDKK